MITTYFISKSGILGKMYNFRIISFLFKLTIKLNQAIKVVLTKIINKMITKHHESL